MVVGYGSILYTQIRNYPAPLLNHVYWQLPPPWYKKCCTAEVYEVTQRNQKSLCPDLCIGNLFFKSAHPIVQK